MAHGPTMRSQAYAPIEIEWNGMEIQSPVLRCQVDFKSWKLQVKSSHEVLCKSTSKSFYCQVKSQTQTQVTPRSTSTVRPHYKILDPPLF